MTATWHAVPALASGPTRVDPYLGWARATGFASLGGMPSARVPTIPVLLELKRPLAELADGAPDALCRITPGYVRAAKGLARIRYCTARVTPSFFDPSANPWLANVERYEIGLAIDSGRARGMNFPMRPPSGVPDLPDAVPPIVAVIDDALPFAAPRYRLEQGDAACWALWDQNDGPGDPLSLLPYGRAFWFPIQSRVDADIAPVAAGDASDLYRRMKLGALSRRWTHGSAVLGLATPARPGPTDTGWPAAGAFIGVQLPKRTYDDTSGMSLGVQVLDALHFVLHAADWASRMSGLLDGPVVANLSYGRHAGAHDGSGMLARAIDELLELRNAAALPFAVVLPAGNGQLARCRARAVVAPVTSRTLTWRIQPDDHTPSFVELWVDGDPSSVRLEVCPPGRVDPVTVGPGEAFALGRGAGCLATVGHFPRSAAGDAPMMLVAVSPTASLDPRRAVAPAGDWRLTVRNTGTSPITVDGWIQRDDTFGASLLHGRQSRFVDDGYEPFDPLGAMRDVDPVGTDAGVLRTDTLASTATGRYTVVVAARVGTDGAIARYSAAGGPASSRGPDASAVADRSAARSGIRTYGTVGGATVAANGTSLAAPQVARWIADRIADPASRPRADANWARELVATELHVPGTAARLRDQASAVGPTRRGEAACLPAAPEFGDGPA